MVIFPTAVGMQHLRFSQDWNIQLLLDQINSSILQEIA